MTTTITTPTTTQSNFDKVLATYIERRNTLDHCDVNGGNENEAMDAVGRTERKLLRTPSANISDLRAKAEIIWQDTGGVPTDDMLSAFFADLRRLTGNEASRTFDAAAWLKWFTGNHGGYVKQGNDIILLWPDFADSNDQTCAARWQLETRGAHDAVKTEIRIRMDLREAEAELSFTDCVNIYEASKQRMKAHTDTKCPDFGTKGCEAYEETTATLADDDTAAIKGLLNCPSPDAQALATKLAIYAEEQVADWTDSHAMAQIMAADAARLAGEA